MLSALLWTFWVVLVVVSVFPAEASSPSACPGIHIKFLDIQNNKGNIGCALFDSPEGFPHEFLQQYESRMVVMKIQDTEASCHFLDVPPGTYALAVIHDENMNGKFDDNWMGVPQEGYGFSNEAKAVMSAPSFEAAEFSYQGQELFVEMPDPAEVMSLNGQALKGRTITTNEARPDSDARRAGDGGDRGRNHRSMTSLS
jgi:uncharacterized protein (DUF2141 family)